MYSVFTYYNMIESFKDLFKFFIRTNVFFKHRNCITNIGQTPYKTKAILSTVKLHKKNIGQTPYKTKAILSTVKLHKKK